MVLSVSRPAKINGVYYFRKGIPLALRPLVGDKWEWKFSLEAKDPDEARRKHAIEAARVAGVEASLRRRLAALSAPALAELDSATIKRLEEAYYVHLLEEDEDQRIDGFRTPERIPHDPTPTFEDYTSDGAVFEALTRDDYARGEVDAFYLTEVDEVLSWDGFEIRLDPESPSRKLVARALQAAAIRASKAKQERNHGEPVETPAYPPPLQKPTPAGSLAAAQPLLTLFDDWWREAEATGHKPSTRDNYRNTINQFIAFLGHDDAARVTSRDVVGFKDYRLNTINARTGKPTSPKTVNDGDLAALKTVLGWGKVNHRLADNAAEGITIKLKKRRRLRPKGFTDDEARALLKAADSYQARPKEKTKTFLAKRWVPWLCAYTGARAGELVQLRKRDVREVDGHPVIFITPEAGTVKDDELRGVVLHSHLIEKGFLDFVASCKDGYLFIDPKDPKRVVNTAKGRRNDVGEFARQTVKDPDVDPNHGWRHRFTTLWLRVGLSDRVLHYIQGHEDNEGGPVHRDYGDVEAEAQAVNLAKFPRQGD